MRAIALTVLFTVLYVTAISADTKGPYYKLGASGYELVLDMRYDEADKIFDEMIWMEPKNAVGYLYKSQSYFHFWQYTLINPEKKDLEKFKVLLFKTADIAEEMLDKDNIDTLFILGSAYGNIGLYYANTNSWVRAWWYGRKGIKSVKNILKNDPDYYNAYFLLGMYNYYAATLPKIIKSLSFLIGSAEGNREEGIEQLKLASSKGDLKDDAKIFLADTVYYEEKDYDAASVLLEELRAKYPNNHYLSLIQAVSCRHLDKYDLSIQTLKSSLGLSSLKEFPALRGNIYYALGLTYSGVNEYNKAISAFKKAHRISIKIKGSIQNQYRYDAWALYWLGDAYEMLGSIDKAHEYYAKVEEKDVKGAFENAQKRIKNPLTPAQIKLIKGRKYSRYKKYSQAAKILRGLINSAAEVESVNNTLKAEACLYLGEVEYHMKEYQNSIRTLNKVSAFDDVKKGWIKPWSHYWLANCYREVGEVKSAEQEFDMAYEYDNKKLRSETDRARGKME